MRHMENTVIDMLRTEASEGTSPANTLTCSLQNWEIVCFCKVAGFAVLSQKRWWVTPPPSAHSLEEPEVEDMSFSPKPWQSSAPMLGEGG